MAWLPKPVTLSLLDPVTCPHCREEVRPSDVLRIAKHDDAGEDPVLPRSEMEETENERFLPSRFSHDGKPIDAGGCECPDLACHHCHLQIPRHWFEYQTIFWSIIGARRSGKSYFLASMINVLQFDVPNDCQFSFDNADAALNAPLIVHRDRLYNNPEPQKLCKLEPTQPTGDNYNSVHLHDHLVFFPRPFVFEVCPAPDHPSLPEEQKFVRTVCLHDIAGEDCESFKDDPSRTVSKHLGTSEVLLFLFDPLQSPRFRKACAAELRARLPADSQPRKVPMDLPDPQLGKQAVECDQGSILTNAGKKIRSERNIRAGKKLPFPLLVVVGKYDAWSSMMDCDPLQSPWKNEEGKRYRVLDMDYIRAISRRVRALLRLHARDIVTAAEHLSSQVYYLPVSATGTPPELDDEGGLAFRPANIAPKWVEVPMLLALSLRMPELFE